MMVSPNPCAFAILSPASLHNRRSLVVLFGTPSQSVLCILLLQPPAAEKRGLERDRDRVQIGPYKAVGANAQ